MEFENDINYLDQHFLINKSIINEFVDEAHLSVEDTVVEIGPGKGQISDTIARRCKHLTCIEIDRELEHFMNVLKDKYDNVDIIYGNALNVYIPECDKIISALPYSITEPFVEKLLRCNFKECLLIVGKKYADAVVNKELNKLALLTNSFFEVTKIMDISPDAFDPKPRVMSSMIRLIPLKRNSLKNSFKKFVFRELFFHRDKKLKNNLMEALIEFAKSHDQKLTKKESKAIVDSYDIPKETLNKLMENLSNDEYKIIYNKLK
jgi:16S rRNA (adenine1518-N6/adenine1519-N6)-dimethyltransferase